MAIRQIRLQGDEMLNKKARTVTTITPSMHDLLDDMLETMRAKDAVGLAAPQVGVLKRIVVVEFDDALYELINPEILETDGTQVSNEACLSVPGRSGDIERPFEVTVKAQNRHGEEYTIHADEFLASAICHELDHLEGKLFLETATNVQFITNEQAAARRKMHRNRRERRLRR
ncbi:MAG: peptide deformylase [Defluviitaleaceae bacterium]|nr:peptide deformylase [Defluviitaleaceae bacterium]MCL2238530.1 peptide deformylase [Defluviitaleaceae bacterium]